MLASVGTVAALAVWDERREATAALADMAGDQSTLATVLAREIEEGLRAASEPEVADVFAVARGVESPGAVVVAVQRPDHEGFATRDGRVVRSPRLAAALASGVSIAILPREEAVAFGLPARAAVAGLAHAVVPRRPPFGVAVLESAQRERERERRGQVRLAVSLLFAAVLVTGFGGIALREQRRELELARRLAVAALARERDEQLARADRMAMLAALSSGIAHEIATPLGVIVARVDQVLPKVEADPRAAGHLAIVLDQVARIQRVVQGVLGLARGESPSLERRAPHASARDAADHVAHRFETAGVVLRVIAPADLPAIACDPPLFEQVLVNLLLNACDACRAGGEVELCCARSERGVAFTVTDSGEGLPEGAAARAAEPFFTTKPRGRGTGLGLAIANEIVKHHGGTLTLLARDPDARAGSATTRGTVARVELPAA
jgi:two-component system NtrC family sensor kinase